MTSWFEHYVRVAADRTGFPIAEVCERLAQRNGVERVTGIEPAFSAWESRPAHCRIT